MVQPSKGVKINWTLKTEPGSQDKNNVKINQFGGRLDLADFAHTKHTTDCQEYHFLRLGSTRLLLAGINPSFPNLMISRHQAVFIREREKR